MSSGNYVAADTAFNPVLVLARAAKVLDLAHVLSSDLKVKLKYHQRADVYFVVLSLHGDTVHFALFPTLALATKQFDLLREALGFYSKWVMEGRPDDGSI